MNILYTFISIIICLYLFVIYILPLCRLKILKDELDKLKKYYEWIIVHTKAIDTTMGKLGAANEEIAAKLKEILPEGETLGSVIKDLLLDRFQKYQDQLLEIERKNDFEPRFWWPKKYCDKLKYYKQEIRILINKMRTN